jgi:hypothetical protein
MGSKHSAPLEQLLGEPLTPASDLYSVGAVMAHCYRGREMYADTGPETAIALAMKERPERVSPRAGATGAESEFVAFVNHCIAVTPRDRPATARACLEALDRVGDKQASS